MAAPDLSTGEHPDVDLHAYLGPEGTFMHSHGPRGAAHILAMLAVGDAEEMGNGYEVLVRSGILQVSLQVAAHMGLTYHVNIKDGTEVPIWLQEQMEGESDG